MPLAARSEVKDLPEEGLVDNGSFKVFFLQSGAYVGDVKGGFAEQIAQIFADLQAETDVDAESGEFLHLFPQNLLGLLERAVNEFHSAHFDPFASLDQQFADLGRIRMSQVINLAYGLGALAEIHDIAYDAVDRNEVHGRV